MRQSSCGSLGLANLATKHGGLSLRWLFQQRNGIWWIWVCFKMEHPKKNAIFPGKDDDRRCLARSGPLLFCDWVDPNVSLQHNGIQWHYHPARQQQIKTCLAASPGPSGRLSQEAHHPTLLLSTRAHFNCISPCLLRQTRVVNRQTRVSSMAVGALGSMAVTFHAELISQQPCRTRHSPEWCNVNATGHVYPAAP